MLDYKTRLTMNWKKDFLGGILGILICCPILLGLFFGMFYLVLWPISLFKLLCYGI